MKVRMKILVNLIFIFLVLIVLINMEKGVFAVDLAQIQADVQIVENNIDTTKNISSMGIYKNPDNLVYSDSSRIYLVNGIILVEFDDGSYELVNMMSPDIEKSVNFDGDSDNIVITFVYNNIMIPGSVILQKGQEDMGLYASVGAAPANANVVGIQIQVSPKNSYIQYYDNLNLAGGKIRVYYDNGTFGIVKMTNPEVTVEGFDNTKVGEEVLTVRYKGFEDKYKIKISENLNPEMGGRPSYRQSDKSEVSGTVVSKTLYDGEAETNFPTRPSNPENTGNGGGYTNLPTGGYGIGKNGDPTTVKGLLPQTGAKPIIIIAMFITIIIVIFAYNKDKIVKNKIKGK